MVTRLLMPQLINTRRNKSPLRLLKHTQLTTQRLHQVNQRRRRSRRRHRHSRRSSSSQTHRTLTSMLRSSRTHAPLHKSVTSLEPSPDELGPGIDEGETRPKGVECVKSADTRYATSRVSQPRRNINKFVPAPEGSEPTSTPVHPKVSDIVLAVDDNVEFNEV